ncbi:MAG: Tfp pilus assembly protein FimT/FimU, partial [Candidatus Krumholzibacteriia bacterium]
MRARQGYSLPEVAVGVVIVGILAVAAIPNIGSYLRSRGTASAAEQMGVHMRLARSRAVMEGNQYFVQFLDNSRYVIVDDDGGADGVPGGAGYVAANRGN